MIKIFGTKTSPFTRKARIVAIEKKLDFEFECFNPGEENKYYLDGKNPLGRIPVLLVNDSLFIIDSPVICEYLDNLAPNKKLIPDNSAREKMLVSRWEALADGICDIAVYSVVYEMRKATEKIDNKLIETSKIEIANTIDLISNELGSNEYCIGQSLTISDIALVCALDFLKFRIPEIKWEEKYPNLKDYLQNKHKLESVKSTSPF